MFANSYFPVSYFAGIYFPPTESSQDVITAPSLQYKSVTKPLHYSSGE